MPNENLPIESDCLAVANMDLHQSPLPEETKARFHKLGRKVLNQLVKRLGLSAGEYTIRHCKGGSAVPGEITLHADKIYIQISHGHLGQHNRVMYRSCKTQRDYTGGQNNWCGVTDLMNSNFIDRMVKIAYRARENHELEAA